MKLTSALRRLAAKVDNLFESKASLAANDAQFDAKQRKEFDITKTEEAKLSGGLGNVVRVPTSGGTGVSQAPAIAEPGTGEAMASEQPPAALQGGVASQPLEAASSADAWASADARKHLMDAVKAARALLSNRQPVRASTQQNYARKLVVLEQQRKVLQESDPQTHSRQILRILLGKYAGVPGSFFAMRRALHHQLEEQLVQALRSQDQLQKTWRDSLSEQQKSSLLGELSAAALELEKIAKSIAFISTLDRESCMAAYAKKHGNGSVKNQDISFAKTKSLVTILNRRMPDWQAAFRAANENSNSIYRAHALIQSLLGIRPVEFDPSPDPMAGGANQAPRRSGVTVSLLETGNVKVTIEGAKLGEHSGQDLRTMELAAHAIPPWFLAQLQQAAGVLKLTSKPQALRDHYERMSAKVFKGAAYGKAHRPLHVTPYCFRHSFATDLRESGWEVEELAAALGQQSSDTQKRYGHRKGGQRSKQPEIAVVRGSVQATHAIKPRSTSWKQIEKSVTRQKTAQRSRKK